MRGRVVLGAPRLPWCSHLCGRVVRSPASGACSLAGVCVRRSPWRALSRFTRSRDATRLQWLPGVAPGAFCSPVPGVALSRLPLTVWRGHSHGSLGMAWRSFPARALTAYYPRCSGRSCVRVALPRCAPRSPGSRCGGVLPARISPPACRLALSYAVAYCQGYRRNRLETGNGEATPKEFGLG